MDKECKVCGQVLPHYGLGMCERCWRAAKARERWHSMPARKKRARLKQMRERARERRRNDA